MLTERDEFQHSVGGHRQWSESYYFNFYDPAVRVGGLTRIGIRPNEQTMDGGFLLYLPDGRVAIQRLVVEANKNTDDLTVLDLAYERVASMRTWSISHAGRALVMDRLQGILDMSLLEAPPTFEDLELDLTFTSIGPPHDIAGSALAAAFGGLGHYDQPGSYEGKMRIGETRCDVHGLGVRDHTWGIRDWQAPKTWNFFSMNFGPELAIVASRIVIHQSDLRGGFVCSRGANASLVDIDVESKMDANGIAPKAMTLVLTDSSGKRLEIQGEVLTAVPVKFEGGATLVTEALTRFSFEGREGYGIAEYLRQLAAPTE